MKVMKERNSSIELLRIISMILIVLYHYHARKYNLYVVDTSRLEDTDFLSKLTIHSLGKLGVPIFVFISGWFGVRFRKDRFFDLLLQCFFYAFLSTILLGACYGSFELKSIVFFLNHWWFIAAYLCLYLLAPGIDYLFETCNKRATLAVVLLFYFVSFGDVVVKSANIGGLYLMLTMYLSARWLRFYGADFLEKYGVILFLSACIIRFGIVGVAHASNHLNFLSYVNSYVSPLTTILAASIFILFSKMRFHVKLINQVAVSCLSVYLFSESGFGQRFFSCLFSEEYSIIGYFYGALLTFVFIVLLDQVRKFLSCSLFKLIKSRNDGKE